MKNCLKLFNEKTAKWFKETLGEPTPVQKEAWPAIAAGTHVLVSAPTGTGKTLSAFLVFLDRLKKEACKGTLKQELQLIEAPALMCLYKLLFSVCPKTPERLKVFFLFR